MKALNNNISKESEKRRPSKLRIFFIVLLSVILITVLVFDILVDYSSDFTEKEHLSRVTVLAKKRYLNNGSKYTDLQVYPIYNQDEKLTHFLIELEPVGYMIVNIHRTNVFSSMYTRSSRLEDGMYWSRYVAEDGTYSVRTDVHGKNIYYNRRWTEVDENGEPIKHYISPFKAYDIQNERRYLANINGNGYIFSVKRNDKYLNLITLDYLDCDNPNEMTKYPTEEIGVFPISHRYDL